MKKHDVNYHNYDDSISFYLDHCNHLDAFKHFVLSRQRKRILFRKESFLINQKSSKTKK
jgi:hypothetical protein